MTEDFRLFAAQMPYVFVYETQALASGLYRLLGIVLFDTVKIFN